ILLPHILARKTGLGGALHVPLNADAATHRMRERRLSLRVVELVPLDLASCREEVPLHRLSLLGWTALNNVIIASSKCRMASFGLAYSHQRKRLIGRPHAEHAALRDAMGKALHIREAERRLVNRWEL